MAELKRKYEVAERTLLVGVKGQPSSTVPPQTVMQSFSFAHYPLFS